MKQKRVFAFDRMNFILLGIGMVAVIIGLILMSGSGSTFEAFNADIFSARRIKVAPDALIPQPARLKSTK